MSSHFDAIVIGCGGFGSSALYHLASRGVKVLGIDRFHPPHDRGSSHGETRIIRKAYFENPDYVPLLKSAYRLWRELEQQSGHRLYHEVGLLLAGPPDSQTMQGAKLAAETHNLDLEEVYPSEFITLFPGFNLPDGFAALIESEAGYLMVEQCQQAYLDQARKRGAELHGGETVTRWQVEGSSVVVETDKGRYSAGRLIITAGPWAGKVLESLHIPLMVARKPLFWFPIRNRASPLRTPGHCFFYEMPWGEFYGFQSLDGKTIKAAEHTGGEHVADPSAVDRECHASDLAGLRRFLPAVIPDLDLEPVSSSVCMYTRTPDSHFIVDRHPEHPSVVLGCGFSGHGFKFTSVIGEALTQLALDGETDHPIGFLNLHRPALRS